MSPGADLSRIPPEKLATSALMPAHLRDDPVSTYIMVTTLEAYRIPVTFMALGETYVVHEKPGLMSKLQRTIAWRAGWTIRPTKLGVEAATVRIWERAHPRDAHEIGFTMADAIRAGLPAQNPTYAKWPDRMLFARACTKSIALICPEVLFDPGLPDLVDKDEWRVLESAGSSESVPPLQPDEPAVPDHVYDAEPEAYADPTGEKYDPLDPTRPFE